MSRLSGLASLRAVREYHFEQYDESVRNRTVIPVTYPLFTYGTALLLLFLLIPPKSIWHSRTTRYLTFAIIYTVNAWVINNCRAYGPATAFGIGITTAWGTVWAATLLIFKDAKVVYRRFERRTSNERSSQTSDAIQEQASDTTEAHLRKRVPGSNKVNGSENLQQQQSNSLVWQSYPAWPFRHRLEWVLDLVGSFRGLAWNWRIAGLPSLPIEVQTQLQPESTATEASKDLRKSKSGLQRFDTRWALIQHNLWVLITSYLIMDFLKVIAIHDPYFWGQVHSPAPSFLPYFISNSTILTRYYRLFVSQCGVWISLRMIYSLGPLFFVGLLGPNRIGVNGEPWLYADQYGGYSNVFERGLAGWWGGWWHQMFRYAFEAGGVWVTECLRLESGSAVAKIIQLFVAFGLSGYIHASGSRTSVGSSNPWHPFLFFILQPVGILAQMFWRQQLKKLGVSTRIPHSVGQIANFIFTHVWFYFTAPLLADDFAEAGVWLFEPVALSPLRALRFGAEGDGLFCWGGRIASWHHSESVLLSGIAL